MTGGPKSKKPPEQQPTPASAPEPEAKVSFEDHVRKINPDYGEQTDTNTVPFARRAQQVLQKLKSSDHNKVLEKDQAARLFNALAKAGFSEALARELAPAIEPHADQMFDTGASADEDVRRVVTFFREAVAEKKSYVSDLPTTDQLLTIPEGDVPRYQGRDKSGDIYQFLLNTYEHRENAQALTLEYLTKNDWEAVLAFRSRRRSAPIPDKLMVLTLEGRGSKQKALLKKHNLEVSTPEGIAEAKQVMGAIGNLVYRR